MKKRLHFLFAVLLTVIIGTRYFPEQAQNFFQMLKSGLTTLLVALLYFDPAILIFDNPIIHHMFFVIIIIMITFTLLNFLEFLGETRLHKFAIPLQLYFMYLLYKAVPPAVAIIKAATYN